MGFTFSQTLHLSIRAHATSDAFYRGSEFLLHQPLAQHLQTLSLTLFGCSLNQVSRLLFLYQSPRIAPGKALLLATEEMLQSMPGPPHCRVRAMVQGQGFRASVSATCW